MTRRLRMVWSRLDRLRVTSNKHAASEWAQPSSWSATNQSLTRLQEPFLGGILQPQRDTKGAAPILVSTVSTGTGLALLYFYREPHATTCCTLPVLRGLQGQPWIRQIAPAYAVSLPSRQANLRRGPHVMHWRTVTHRLPNSMGSVDYGTGAIVRAVVEVDYISCSTSSLFSAMPQRRHKFHLRASSIPSARVPTLASIA